MGASIEQDPWIGSAPSAPSIKVPKALFWIAGGCGLLMVLAVGGLVALGFAIESGHVPDSAAVPGHELKRRTVRFLRGENLLSADEKILYFYSGATLNLRDSGSFITDRRVVDYENVDDEMIVDEARYEEIASVRFTKTEGFFEDSSILVRCDDGHEFGFDVANEGGGAEAFERLLRLTWQIRRSGLELPQDGLTITESTATPAVFEFLRAHGLLDDGEKLVVLLGVPDAPLANWGILCTDVKLVIYEYEADPAAIAWELEHARVAAIRRGEHTDPAWVRFHVAVEQGSTHDVDFYGTADEVARFESLWREAWNAVRKR